MFRLLAGLLLAVPASALAQSGPPPPPPLVAPPSDEPSPPPLVSPPAFPAPDVPAPPTPKPNLFPQNLQAYPPLVAQPQPAPQHEFGLATGEFFASVAVSLAATLGAYAVFNGTGTSAASQITQVVVMMLYTGLAPTLTSLPAWGLSFLSKTYEPRLSPSVEVGSIITAAAWAIFYLASATSPTGKASTGWLYATGGLLVVGMPLGEVIALNVTKVPRASTAPPTASSIAPELPARHAELGPAARHTVVLGLPAVAF